TAASDPRRRRAGALNSRRRLRAGPFTGRAGDAIFDRTYFESERKGMAEGLFARLSGRGQAQRKSFPVALSEEEWRGKLSAAQYRVLREHGTERAGSSPLDKQYGPGVYHCAGCGQPLFAWDTKFNSGTGWPGFWAPVDDAVETETDRSLFMTRTEVHCS